MGGRGSSSSSSGGGTAETGQTRTKAFTSSSSKGKSQNLIKQVEEVDKMFTSLGTKNAKRK